MSTALAVVEEMQSKVGGALVGGSATVMRQDEPRDSHIGIQLLEQLRDLQLKTVQGITRVYDLLNRMLNFDKAEARRARDNADANLLTGPAGLGNDNDDIDGNLDARDNSGGGIGNFASAAGGGLVSGLLLALKKRLTKIFQPLINFFGKAGPFGRVFARLAVLLPFLGRFGPIGLVITGIQLLMYYMDEIVEALSPVLDLIDKMWTAVKPLFDAILVVADKVIKLGLAGIGLGIEIAAGLIGTTFDTFLASLNFVSDLIWGIVTGDMELIKEAWTTIKAEFTRIGNDIIGVFTGAFDSLIAKIEEIFGIDDLVGTVTTAFNDMVAWFKKIGLAIYNPETGALFGYTWDMVKGTITDSFDSMGTWFGNLGKKIYNSETGELFGYQLPTLPSLSDIGIWFTDLEKKIYNPETGELFGYQLPAMPSLSDIGTWFTDLGNKVYNGETNSLFGYQLPELPTLSTMFDKIKEIRNKIYDPETGKIFGFTMPSFSDFELPNIGDMIKKVFASILPSPDSWLFKFLPDGMKQMSTDVAAAESATLSGTVESMPNKMNPNEMKAAEVGGTTIVKVDGNNNSTATTNNQTIQTAPLDTGQKLAKKQGFAPLG